MSACTCRSLSCSACSLARFGPLPDAQPYIDAENRRRRAMDLLAACERIEAESTGQVGDERAAITHDCDGAWSATVLGYGVDSGSLPGCILALAAAIEGRQ